MAKIFERLGVGVCVCLFVTTVHAHQSADGRLEIRINPDGSFSYFFAPGADFGQASAATISEDDIAAVLDGSPDHLTGYKLLTPQNEAVGVYVSAASLRKNPDLFKAIAENYKIEPIGNVPIPTTVASNAISVLDPSKKPQGVFLPTDPSTKIRNLPSNWNQVNLAAMRIPVPGVPPRQ